MRSGDVVAGSRGIALLALLAVLAGLSLGIAAVGRHWSTAVQREREQELLERGGEIRRAIESYVAAVPGMPQWPSRLQDLVSDDRFTPPRHHLRRLYADPFTGQADWLLMSTPDAPERFYGVRSRSRAPSLNRRAADVLGEGGLAVGDWRFAGRAPSMPLR